MLVFDTETHLIRPGLLAPPLVCVSYARSVDDVRLALAGAGADVVEAALDDGEVLVGHNIAFDFAVLVAFRPDLLPKIFKAYEEGRVRDTKIRQQLNDIAAGCLNMYRNSSGTKGYSLADLEKHYLGRDRSAEKQDPNGWRMRFAELDGVPLESWPSEAVGYAMEDAAGTLEVFQAQGPMGGAAMALFQAHGIDYQGLPLTNEVEQVQAAWCLHLCSVVGMRTNATAVITLEKDTRDRFLAMQQKMVSEGLIKIRKATSKEIVEGKVDFWDVVEGQERAYRYSKNMSAIRQRVELAYQKVGQEEPRTDPTATAPEGNVKTDADTLAYSGDPVLEELGEGGPISTILKTFIPTLKRGTSVAINSRFNTLVETGRPSSADPNLYNIPREGGVRECFEARPGNVFCSVDFDCAELRSLAQVCLWLFGKSALAEFFQKDPNGDPHTEFAADIIGISSDEAKVRKSQKCTGSLADGRALGKCLHCEVGDMRQMCKAFNFGFPGGMGADSMVSYARKAYGVIVQRSKAVEAKQKWLNRWPEMRLYFEYISKLVGMGGAQVMQMRPGNLPHRLRGNVGYCDGCNGFFQGLTADGAKHALWLVTEEAYTDESSPLFAARARPVVFLYDEVITELLAACASPAAWRQAELMRMGMQVWLPDVPVTCAPALMNRWSKKAKTVIRDGVLVPFDEEVRAAA